MWVILYDSFGDNKLKKKKIYIYIERERERRIPHILRQSKRMTWGLSKVNVCEREVIF